MESNAKDAHITGQRINRRKFLSIAALALGGTAAGSLLSACQPAPPQAAPPAAAPTAAPAATSVAGARATPAPAASGGLSPATTLMVGGWSEPATVDPAIEVDQWGRSLFKNAYDTLVDREGASLELKPSLATSWEITNGGKTYTFKLRDDVKFVDGTTLDAEAVKISLDRSRTINQGLAYMLVDVDTITAVDPQTLRIDMKEVYAPFLEALFWFGVISPTALRNNDNGNNAREFMRNHTVGSGPYQLDRWDPGQQIVTVRNPNYWKGFASNTPIEAMVARVIKEPASQRLMLERGDLDIAQITSIDDIATLQNNPDITVHADDTLGRMYYSIMNTKKGPTADKYVRQAISWAFPYEDYIQLALNGHGKQAVGPFPPDMVGGDVPGIIRYTRDMAKAKEALAQSQWPNGGFSLDYWFVSGLTEEKTTGELLQSSLRELNIQLSIQEFAFPQIIQAMANSETAPNLVALYTSSPINHPDGFVYFLFYSKGNRNWGFYDNPRVDELILNARKELDTSRAQAMYQEISRIVTEDAVSLNISQPVNVDYMRNTVKGYVYNPMYIKMFRLREMWLEGK